MAYKIIPTGEKYQKYRGKTVVVRCNAGICGGVVLNRRKVKRCEDHAI